jgi:hypothetical protein
MSAVESEGISNELIEAAAGRILRVKARLKKSEKKDIDYRRHKMLSSQISEMSVSLLKNTPGLLPIRDQSAIPVTFVGDYESFDTAHMRNYFTVNSGDGKEPDVKGKTCLICIFTNVAAWKGSSGISEYEISRTHNLIGNSGHSIVISFGSPYVLRHFNDADILIAAYEATNGTEGCHKVSGWTPGFSRTTRKLVDLPGNYPFLSADQPGQTTVWALFASVPDKFI